MGGDAIKLIFFIYFVIVSSEITQSSGENVSNTGEQTKTISKRYDLDFQTCVENFDILKDNIIRTQDSRAMGAKYINEIDVSSREECLRLCCETNTCDVFVFEEKNPGSCYLFHCGSPGDFKCQFTKHHNYTSAVLAVSRQMTELENQIKLTRHEQELTRLRKPDNSAEPSTVQPFSATTVLPPGPPAKETVQPIPAASNSSSDRRCSRFQFECHSSGECIAIYNACDGIPQCADGSDEAPELGCPELGTTQTPQALAAILTQSPTSGNKEASGVASAPTHNMQHQQRLGHQLSQYNNMASQPYRQQAQQQQQQQQQSSWPLQQLQSLQQQTQQYDGSQPSSNGVNSNNNQKVFPASANNQQQQQQQLQGNKMYGREGEGPAYNTNNNNNNNNNNNLQWQSYQQGQQISPPAGYQGSLNQFQGGSNREFEDQSSHIFNHKGNGLVADSDSPAAQYNDVPHNDYKYGNNGPNNYYNNGGPYRQQSSNWQAPHQSPLQDLNSISSMDDISPHMGDDRNTKMGSGGSYNAQPIPPDYYYEDSQEGRFHSHPHDIDVSHQHPSNHFAQGEQENIADGATPIKSKEQHAAHKFKSSLEEKLEADLSTIPKRKGSSQQQHAADPQTTISTEVTTSKTEVTKASPERSSHLKKTHKVEINLEEVNFSENVEEEPGRPSGAILSLALGLCITGIMVILIGCRLRVVRRRLRRGGKSPYAHDADYLVNGMYL